MKMTKLARSYGHAKKTAPCRQKTRGVALITALLLLMLMVAMTFGMVIAVTSDTLIAGYYKTYRASFYAADSGANIARQYMLNQLVTNATVAVGTTFVQGSAPPLSGTDASTTLTNTINQFQSSASLSNRQLNTGGGANSWPGSFYVVQTQAGTPGTTLAAPNCTPIFTPPNAGTGTVTPATGPYNCGANYPTCAGTCTNFAITDFQYQFPYTITTVGQSGGSQQQLVEDSGQLILNIHVAPSGGTNQNFAGWGMFIDQYSECDGSTLVPGTITGPVFTNGAWNFGTSGSYIFTDKVGSASSTFGYQFGSCYSSGASSYKSGAQTIAPTFQSGYTLGAHTVPLPTDSFNQEEAVVDGRGTSCAGVSNCPSKATLNANLADINGTAYPLTGASSGVFLGYSQTTSGGVTTNTMTGGGILVEGNASVTLTASTVPNGSSTDPVQVYTITQGSTTTTVTVDITSNYTTVHSGTKTTTIHGVPSVSGGSEATMLYVDGNISALTGPSSGAAIQDGFATTVTAASNITITGNILYKTEPVTMTQNQIPGTPADTLIPGNNNGQVLGIFTAGGNVNLGLTTSGQNLEIDASIATIKNGGSGGLVNTGQAINTLNIVGGRIQNTIQNINSTTRNVFFDRRFAQGNFAPPWFPSTTITGTPSDSVTSVVPSFQRTQWVSPIS
jgi:hypothetical protein